MWNRVVDEALDGLGEITLDPVDVGRSKVTAPQIGLCVCERMSVPQNSAGRAAEIQVSQKVPIARSKS